MFNMCCWVFVLCDHVILACECQNLENIYSYVTFCADVVYLRNWVSYFWKHVLLQLVQNRLHAQRYLIASVLSEKKEINFWCVCVQMPSGACLCTNVQCGDLTRAQHIAVIFMRGLLTGLSTVFRTWSVDLVSLFVQLKVVPLINFERFEGLFLCICFHVVMLKL